MAPGAVQPSPASHQPTGCALSKVLITVLDINDVRPQFSKSQFSTSVYENEPAGTSVITMSATDLDEGDNGVVTYSIEGPGAGTRMGSRGSSPGRSHSLHPISCGWFGLLGNTESVEASLLLCSFQFLLVWDVRTLPAFILQPSLGICSCLPHSSRSFYVHQCVLEQIHCLL